MKFQFRYVKSLQKKKNCCIYGALPWCSSRLAPVTQPPSAPHSHPGPPTSGPSLKTLKQKYFPFLAERYSFGKT